MSQNYTPNIGNIVDDPHPKRDAVHIAVAPVVAGQMLAPGVRVRLDSTTKVAIHSIGNDPTCVGIVDPFLQNYVHEGQTFWLFLLPNTITGLRHMWSHPAFSTSILPSKES